MNNVLSALIHDTFIQVTISKLYNLILEELRISNSELRYNETIDLSKDDIREMVAQNLVLSMNEVLDEYKKFSQSIIGDEEFLNSIIDQLCESVFQLADEVDDQVEN